ncbi:MAG: cobalamin-dependent protein [Candidatus Cloacimonadaceae bacterium]|nr:cobalamin-dependent protein [Candidatus Cloacimonadaceae bacterium]
MINQPHIDAFIKALLSMDQDAARRLMENLTNDRDAIKITSQLIVPALEFIGSGWERGNIALSQVYMSGRICEKLIDEILPPGSPQRTDLPVMGIGVLNDHHVLGKRVIYSALRASGYDLIDLGFGLSSQDMIDITLKNEIKILLISVLMLPSALHVKEITTALKPHGIKIIVGGAPFRFDKKLFREVGADATGDNAGEAIQIVTRLVEEYYATV